MCYWRKRELCTCFSLKRVWPLYLGLGEEGVAPDVMSEWRGHGLCTCVSLKGTWPLYVCLGEEDVDPELVSEWGGCDLYTSLTEGDLTSVLVYRWRRHGQWHICMNKEGVASVLMCHWGGVTSTYCRKHGLYLFNTVVWPLVWPLYKCLSEEGMTFSLLSYVHVCEEGIASVLGVSVSSISNDWEKLVFFLCQAQWKRYVQMNKYSTFTYLL